MAEETQLKVDLLAHSSFSIPADIAWDTDGDEASALVEFAGRACYETWDKPNPHTAMNESYIRHILDVGHISVLEHATATLYFRGVSRSCGQEIMRHRLFSFSQLSQRYVPENDSAVVIPESIGSNPALRDLFLRTVDLNRQAYEELYEGIQHNQDSSQHTVLREKQARQAARAIFPQAVETRFVMTGNYRSWRHFIGMRATEHADPEIRRVAVAALKILQNTSPHCFADFSITSLADGGEMATSPYAQEI